MIGGWAVVHVLSNQIGQSFFLFYVHVCDLNFLYSKLVAIAPFKSSKYLLVRALTFGVFAVMF